ncbi:MFS transporter [Streptomyces capoamus]|uniref:MFS transporter n=1 Tax=Streptomyces capoamus TaxID=68183 RepID=A0A919C2Z7_9ACTN|nr:MFS transporter [Streptomyces capoamus]GGW13779.1 MFS transporter [Streptomyces libani subsp. rufus]GHG40878.1 MFS transporter [Streptomyces capoamus]
MTADAQSTARAATAAGPVLPGAFWWLWAATLVNRLGGFVVVFLSLYVTLDRGGSASFAGFVTTLYGVGGAVGSVVGGLLADRLGRRVTLLGAQLLSAAGTGALAFAQGRTALAVTACLVGLAGTASRPVVQAVVADLVGARARVRAFSLLYWAVNIGVAVSAALAGVLAQRGYTLLFLGEAAVTVVCALTVYLAVGETRPDPVRHADDAGPGTRAGAERSHRRRFVAFVAVTFLVGLLMQEVSTALPLTMTRAGLGARDYGLVISLNGLLVVALQLPAGRILARFRPAGPLAVGTLLLGGGLGTTAVAASPGTYALTVVVWTVGEILLAPTAMAAVADLVPDHAHGRHQGMYSFAWSAAACVAPAVSGYALDAVGPTALWGASATLGALAAAGYFLVLRGRREQDD